MGSSDPALIVRSERLPATRPDKPGTSIIRGLPGHPGLGLGVFEEPALDSPLVQAPPAGTGRPDPAPNESTSAAGERFLSESSTVAGSPARPPVLERGASPVRTLTPEPGADEPEDSGAFALSEWQDQDIDANDAGLESFIEDPALLDPDPPDDNPWGGTRRDQDGSG